MKSAQPTNTRRVLGALLALGFILSLVASIGGGLILAFGHSQTTASQPMWKLGQYMMGMGLTNLFVYLCIFFQLRKLTLEVDDYRTSQPHTETEQVRGMPGV